MNEYKETEYRAKVQYENGCTHYPVILLHFNEDMIGKELWVNKSWGDRGVVKINDANIPEKDLYYLGFKKIIEIQKVETVTNVTKIY